MLMSWVIIRVTPQITSVDSIYLFRMGHSYIDIEMKSLLTRRDRRDGRRLRACDICQGLTHIITPR